MKSVSEKLCRNRIPAQSTDPYPSVMENRTAHARGPVHNISSVTYIWSVPPYGPHLGKIPTLPGPLFRLDSVLISLLKRQREYFSQS